MITKVKKKAAINITINLATKKIYTRKAPKTYASLSKNKMQIRIYFKQINFILKTYNYTKKYKVLSLNLGLH